MELELLLEENPNYFYDILLPYVYIFGISSKWSKKFESITIQPPTWYIGKMKDINSGRFDINKLSNSLNHILAQTSSTMSSRPYQSSGLSSNRSFSGGGG